MLGVKYRPEFNNVSLTNVSSELILDVLEEYEKPLLVHTWHKAEYGGATPSSTPDIIAEFARRRLNLRVEVVPKLYDGVITH